MASGDCSVGHAGCVEFLKPCNTFGAAVLQNIGGRILSGFCALPHLISKIAKANLVDETGMNIKPSALGNRFSPVFHALSCCLLVLLKVPLVNAKNVQLRQRREKILLFCLKIT